MDRLMDSPKADGDFFTSIGWRRITTKLIDVYVSAPIIRVNIPRGLETREDHFCFKMSFDNKTRVLEIRSFDNADKVMMNYGVIFTNYKATDVTEEDVKLAVSPEFLSSRFKLM